MDRKSDAVLQSGPQQTSRRYRDASNVFGFPTSANQFRVLETEQSATSSRSIEQRQEGLIDPRTTRQRRWASRGTEAQRTETERAIVATVSLDNAQGICTTSGSVINPVAIQNSSQLFHSFSASPSENFAVQSVGQPVPYVLDTGVNVRGGDDSLYSGFKCNKRISCAGPERSAGRPGHTPIRRRLACGKLVEDSYAGQDWSAGRPGNRPFGASSAACLSPHTACLGPYGSAPQQQQNTGPNTRKEKFVTLSSSSPRRPRESTSQQLTMSSGGFAAAAEEENASPAKVVLHPRRPPYYCGGLDDDVYVWTSIVDRWFDTIRGEPSQQLTFVVSLLRGAAYEWYMQHETRTGCPGDWTTLRQAMLERFGSSIRAEKARGRLYQLRQDKMTVLQYADAFESCLAQMEDYDESYYLVHFIFGLRPEIMRGVYLQQPASILAAKEMAEKLELTHQATASHQRHTKVKKTTKTAQHSGTQEWQSGRRLRDQQKTFSAVRQKKRSVLQHSGCVFAHTGALEASCLERHGPAAVWRSFVKDLPQRDRTGYVRRKGSVVTVDLVALAREKEQRSADPTVAGMSMHPPSGRAHAPRVYLRNRLLRRDRERRTRASVRERRIVTSLLETLVSPSSGGTESCKGVTISILQDWQSIGLKKADTGKEKGRVGPEEPQTQLSVISIGNQSPVPRAEEDGILMIVPARIFGREIRALIDSGATRNFISPAGVTQCGLTVESHNTFLELGDGKKVLSRGRAVDVPVVTSGFLR